MPIEIRAADLNKDQSELIDSMLHFLTQRSDNKRFDWLYRKNPDGPARVWVAVDKNRQNIVGSGAAIPRQMYVEGELRTGCLMADFWIHPHYRSLGPATQLQSACMEDFRAGRFTLCYDFPQSSMGAVYKRLKIIPQEKLVRLSKPLRVNDKVEQKIEIPKLKQIIAKLGNTYLALRDRRRGGFSNCTISVHEGDYGEEFSSLERRVSARYGICVRRSAEYLNWRYGTHYHLQYEVLTARQNGTLMAYILFVDASDHAQIVDLFGVDDPEILKHLIVALVFRLRERGKSAITVQLLESHRWVVLFLSLGFYARESFPLLAISSERPTLNSPEISKWFLMYGDIDT